ncbi:MAG: hypothetical protein NXI01_02710 [Gammaproteobacteria bacterium]|nr:hypothetical protein [Gammaproteobacteria bacterium]
MKISRVGLIGCYLNLIISPSVLAVCADSTIHLDLDKENQVAYPIGFSSYIMPQQDKQTLVFETLNPQNPSIVDFMDSVGFALWTLPNANDETTHCLDDDVSFGNYVHCIDDYFNASGQKPYPNAYYKGKLEELIHFAEKAHQHHAKLAYGIMNVPYAFRRDGSIEGEGLQDPEMYATWLAARIYFVQEALHQANPELHIDYVDMSNEPDYLNSKPGSSGYISPKQYEVVVQELRKILDEKGLAAIQLIGPNLSRLSGIPEEKDSGFSFVTNMGVTASSELTMFGFHTWWNDATNTGQTDWTKQIQHIKSIYPDKPVIVSEFASIVGKDNDNNGQWKYPTLQVEAAGDRLDPMCDAHYHYPDYPAGPGRPCMLSDLVSWGTTIANNIAQLYNANASQMLLWTGEDEDYNTFPLSFGMVRFDGTPRPFFYLIKGINQAFPVNAHIVSRSSDAGLGLYDPVQYEVTILIPNFTDKEKSVQIEGMPENASLRSALYYSPSCFYSDAHDDNYWCALEAKTSTQMTVPAYGVGLARFNLTPEKTDISWNNRHIGVRSNNP